MAKTTLSSRVNEIFIHLPEYSFFHDPFESDSSNDRFVGRKRLIGRLKSLLSNSETKSGAYLITGYRGMGKTSLVNHALKEVTAHASITKKFSRYVRLLAAIIILAIIQTFELEYWITVSFLAFLATLQVVRSLYIRQEPTTAETRAKPTKKHLANILESLKNHVIQSFQIKMDSIPGNRFNQFSQDALVVLIIEIFSLMVQALFETSSIIVDQLPPFVIILIPTIPSTSVFIDRLFPSLGMLFLISLYTLLKDEWDKETNNPKLVGFFKHLTRKLLNTIAKSVNFSQRVYIRLNLGYDDLREIDVLRLVVRGVYQGYLRKIKGYSIADVFWKLVRIAIVYLTVSSLYHNSSIEGINNSLKLQSELIYYFPSQGMFLLRGVETGLIDTVLADSARPHKLLTADWVLQRMREFKDPDKVDTLVERKTFAPQDRRSIRSLARSTTIYADFILQLMYHELGKQILKSPVTPLDYLLLAYFILSWLAITLFVRHVPLGTVTHHDTLKKMRELNESMEAQVTREVSGSMGTERNKHTLFWQKRKTATFPIVNEREAENQLIEILNDITKGPRLTHRPEFVFIFDELDKIEPVQSDLNGVRTNQHGGWKEQLVPIAANPRERQKHILRILSNLKNLLTTAKAKFIFIAGREMFDAALADVSDRNYFLGSIFHEVLYVDSFLTDPSDRKLSDITNLTESFVCRFILPPRYEDKTLGSVKRYYEELQQKKEPGEKSRQAAGGIEINRDEMEFVLIALRNFIIYLTYRSNGAPKKIATYFDSFVTTNPDWSGQHATVVGPKAEGLYLRFGFYAQFTFGMITYLVNPFMNSINKSMRDYGDKLLVSSSFLVDQLYKFHRVAFSWSNIETAPEFLDINRAPQLRELISNIMRFLSHTHIQRIDNGLFEFKFTRRLSQEISFLSKISERESAAFNFTLDESLQSKRYFSRRLEQTTVSGETRSDGNTARDTSGAIVHFRTTLGDLHFFDEEYEDAVREYSVALEGLQPTDAYGAAPLLLQTVQVTMKLALAYERKREYLTAFTIYGRASQLVLEHSKHYKVGKRDSILGYSTLEGTRFAFQPLLSAFQAIEKSHYGGITKADLHKCLADYRSIEKVVNSQKNPLVRADFHNRLGDILYFKNSLFTGSERVDKSHATNSKKGSSNLRHIHCRGAKSLCAKNQHVENLIKRKLRVPCDACHHYMSALEDLLLTNLNCVPPKTPDNNKRVAFVFESLMANIAMGDPARLDTQRGASLKIMANTLSDIGDTFFSCSTRKETIRPEFLKHLAILISAGDYEQRAHILNKWANLKLWKGISKLEELILYHYLAAIYFMHSGEYEEYSYQLSKILNVLYEYFHCDSLRRPDDYAAPTMKLGKAILPRIIRGMYRTYENTARLELKKINDEIIPDGKPEGAGKNNTDMQTPLHRLSINWEVTEPLAVFNKILMKLASKPDVNYFLALRQKSPVSQYSTIYSMYNRVINLRFQAAVNYEITTRLGCFSVEKGETRYTSASINQSIVADAGFDSTDDFVSFLLSDSIFCLYEVIKCCKIYGSSYVISHSLIASAHHKLAYWCDLWKAFLKNHATPNKKKRMLDNLIAVSDIETASSNFHREMALRHYRKALESHRERRSYYEFLDDMSYLFDDFDDSLYHFSAAKERYRINSGQIEKAISELRNTLSHSRLYSYETYFPGATSSK